MAEDLEEDYEDDDDGAPAADGEPASGKKGSKKIILIAAPILLLLGLGAGLYFSGVLDSLFGPKAEKPAVEEAAEAPPPAAEEHEAKESHGGKKEKKEKGEKNPALASSVFMDLPEMLVNLQSTGRKQSFLKIHVTLELDNPSDQTKVDAVMPRIVDSFQVYLRELRADDLQGAAGMHLLREELLSRISLAVQPVKVKDVLFREILIQ